MEGNTSQGRGPEAGLLRQQLQRLLGVSANQHNLDYEQYDEFIDKFVKFKHDDQSSGDDDEHDKPTCHNDDHVFYDEYEFHHHFATYHHDSAADDNSDESHQEHADGDTKASRGLSLDISDRWYPR